MDIKTIDRKMSHLDVILENCDSQELRDHYMDERISLGEKKIAACDEMMKTVLNQEASGLITEDAAEAMLEQIDDAKTDALYDTYPWFEDAANAAGLKLALNEVAALSSAIVGKVAGNAIGKGLTLPLRKFIMSRLSKYTMLHPEAVDFKKLSSEKYDLIEAEKKGIKFQHAGKWLDKVSTRIHVVIYSYKGKEVMAIAYTQDQHVGVGMQALVEPVIKDSSFSKHQDYYVACMCTKLQLTHPCVKRVFDKMKKEWSAKTEEMKEAIQESVEDAIANGTYERKLQLILECAKDGKMSPSDAKAYVQEMRRSEIHMD